MSGRKSNQGTKQECTFIDMTSGCVVLDFIVKIFHFLDIVHFHSGLPTKQVNHHMFPSSSLGGVIHKLILCQCYKNIKLCSVLSVCHLRLSDVLPVILCMKSLSLLSFTCSYRVLVCVCALQTFCQHNIFDIVKANAIFRVSHSRPN